MLHLILNAICTRNKINYCTFNPDSASANRLISVKVSTYGVCHEVSLRYIFFTCNLIKLENRLQTDQNRQVTSHHQTLILKLPRKIYI